MIEVAVHAAGVDPWSSCAALIAGASCCGS
jgi:hypothetical protein